MLWRITEDILEQDQEYLHVQHQNKVSAPIFHTYIMCINDRYVLNYVEMICLNLLLFTPVCSQWKKVRPK